MTRKEEILYATLELASEYGLKAVTLSQIAEKVGIRKPSLYNHFSSKEEIMDALYLFIRDQAKKNTVPPPDISAYTDAGLADILLGCFRSYYSFITNKDMLAFFKVLYSERSTSAAAAQIMLEETDRMINTVKSLFYALAVHGRMKNEDIDTAAVSYALTVHALVNRQFDMITSGKADISDGIPSEAEEYIRWFSRIMEVNNE